MKQHELEQLLKRAADAPNVRGDSSVSPEAIADRARVLVRRHRRIRATACATTGLAMVLLLASLSVNRNIPDKMPGPIIANDNDVPEPELDYDLQIKRLRREADQQMRLVRAMQEANTPRRETSVQLPVGPAPTLVARVGAVKLPVEMIIQQEAEVTARVMLEQGSRWLQQADHREDGIRSYQRTVELFPTTVAARIAKDRLRKIENQLGVKI